MALGAGTAVINGQRFDLPQSSAWFPQGFGPQTTGVPQHSPTMPPFLGGAPGGGGASGAWTSVNGYGTADNNSTVTAIAAAHPFSMKASPTLWAVFGLILALVLLQKIHWRKTILSGEAQLGVGGERARAEAEL